MDRQRIQLHTDSETKRRIQLAARKTGVPMSVYCMDAICRQLADDGLLERTTHNDSLLDDIRALHAEMLASRGSRPLEIDVLQMVRVERDEEIAGSC